MKNSILLTISITTVSFGGYAMDTSAPTPENPITITAKNFESFAQDEKPFIVDVWAEWCGPCKAVKPIFEKVAQDNPEYRFGSLDFQTQADLAKQLKIKSLPTFLIIKANKEYGRIKGARDVSSPEALLAKIKECLKNENPTEIGDASLSDHEWFIQLAQLRSVKTLEGKTKVLKVYLGDGLKPETVLIETPAAGNLPATKITAISLILQLAMANKDNNPLLKVLVENGATTSQLEAEIDTNIKRAQNIIKVWQDIKNHVQEEL